MQDWITISIGFIIAYLLGSIPTAVWVGKWFYGKDIRNEGSGNAGATNTFRILGAKAAIPVIIIDVLKGYLAVYLMQFFIPSFFSDEYDVYVKIIAGLIVVLGHALPVFAGFRGGKGVGILFGVGIALYPIAVCLPVAVAAIIFLSSGCVSLGSVLGAIYFPF